MFPHDDMPSVGIEVLPHAAGLPPLAPMTAGAAGYDLRAAVEGTVTVPAGQARLVPAGIRLEIPPGYEAQVRPRSGLAMRSHLGILNSPGTIDSDYRGEVQVLLFNFGDAPCRIARGDRIAQLVFARVHRPLIEPRALGATARGAGGFGHTG
jgi:dUTP pyrophosphatase